MPSRFVFWGAVSAVLMVLRVATYIVSILRGKTKPSRAGWWIWAVVGFTIFAIQYQAGERANLWGLGVSTLGPLLVAILSLKYGEGGWSAFDRRCMAGACLGALAYVISPTLQIPLLLNIWVDFMGVLPTLRKAYHSPEGEDRFSWSLSWISNTLALFAIDVWSFDRAVYFIYRFCASGSIALCVLAPRRKS